MSDVVKELRGWQRTASRLDRALNSQEEVDSAVVAAQKRKEVAARSAASRGRMSRSAKRKEEFLAREREKARLQKLREFEQLPREERVAQYQRGLSALAKVWGGMFVPQFKQVYGPLAQGE